MPLEEVTSSSLRLHFPQLKEKKEGFLKLSLFGTPLRIRRSDTADFPSLEKEQLQRIQFLFEELKRRDLLEGTTKVTVTSTKSVLRVRLLAGGETKTLELHVPFYGSDHTVQFRIRKPAIRTWKRVAIRDKKAKIRSLVMWIIKKIAQLIQVFFQKRRKEQEESPTEFSRDGLSQEIKNEVQEIFKDALGVTLRNIEYYLRWSTKDEKHFIRYLEKKIDWKKVAPSLQGKFGPDGSDIRKTVITEVLKGAHVVVVDEGNLYQDLCENLSKKYRRVSSHKSDARQYAFRGPLFKEMLFSRKTCTVDGLPRVVSWFQSERYSAKHPLHLFSWAQYKVSGKNIGPFGKSSHREGSQPIILYLKK